MKVKAAITETNGSFYLTVLATTPFIGWGSGKTVEEAVRHFYSDRRIRQGEFEINGKLADVPPRSEQERVLELYLYQGQNNYFEEVRPFERQAFEILGAFPGAKAERTQDIIQINLGEYGDETGVIIVLASDLLEVRFPNIEWVGPHSPLSISKTWRRLEGEQVQNINLINFIHEAQAERRKTFQQCKYCNQLNPPGWMHQPDVCDSCAEKHLGVVH